MGNYKTLTSDEAIQKLKKIAEKTGICLMHTNVKHYPSNIRPMSLQEADNDAKLWFFSSSDSDKNEEIKENENVTLTFQNNTDHEYLVVHGTASISKDQDKINEFWDSKSDAWFDGKDDPKLTLICVQAKEGEYWDSKNGKILTLAKIAFAAVTGNEDVEVGETGELKMN